MASISLSSSSFLSLSYVPNVRIEKTICGQAALQWLPSFPLFLLFSDWGGEVTGVSDVCSVMLVRGSPHFVPPFSPFFPFFSLSNGEKFAAGIIQSARAAVRVGLLPLPSTFPPQTRPDQGRVGSSIEFDDDPDHDFLSFLFSLFGDGNDRLKEGLEMRRAHNAAPAPDTSFFFSFFSARRVPFAKPVGSVEKMSVGRFPLSLFFSSPFPFSLPFTVIAIARSLPASSGPSPLPPPLFFLRQSSATSSSWAAFG